jgi:uncharacterized protein (DUF924 family)
MEAEPTDTIEIFICYAHEDEEYRKSLEKQLRVLKRQHFINVWHDREIVPGMEWQREIDSHLNTAEVILLLISPDFMDSDYCYGIEMVRAMERHECGETQVIPIIIRHVYWEKAPFGKLQALPKDGVPVTDQRWHSLDIAFFDVAEGIRKVIETIQEEQKRKAEEERQRKTQRQVRSLRAERLPHVNEQQAAGRVTPVKNEPVPIDFDEDEDEQDYVPRPRTNIRRYDRPPQRDAMLNKQTRNEPVPIDFDEDEDEQDYITRPRTNIRRYDRPPQRDAMLNKQTRNEPVPIDFDEDEDEQYFITRPRTNIPRYDHIFIPRNDRRPQHTVRSIGILALVIGFLSLVTLLVFIGMVIFGHPLPFFLWWIDIILIVVCGIIFLFNSSYLK